LTVEQRDDMQAICPPGLYPEGGNGPARLSQRALSAAAVACGYPLDFVLRTAFDVRIDEQISLSAALTPKGWDIRQTRRANTSSRWSEHDDALLGHYPDATVARMIGRTLGAVEARRMRLRIPSYVAPLTPEELSLIGTDTDQNIAEVLGRKRSEVTRIRSQLKIPAIQVTSKGHTRWNKDEIALLGTGTDAEIARILGRSESSVTNARNRRGIPPAGAQALQHSAGEEKSYGT
jgi:hypothetical protein